MAPTTDESSAARPAARRWTACGAGAGVVVAGLAVHLLAPDGFASDAAGDALYAVLIYLIVVFVAPRAPGWAAAGAAYAWCVAVELLQLTGLPAAWGSAFRPSMLVFGTVFSVSDLVFYAAGVALAWAGDALVRRVLRR
ncbi:DUF2809 domain-containing protein [Microbacterium marinilacus]|nr:DUF2809 domain-containing protein [Microbacterium marinilacus]MBY0688589.1 DUF2809 domain-containing protein [Microbacterium marinilacus]